MKVMWCWRCRQDVAMLDEDEYASIDRLYGECFEAARTRKVPLSEAFAPVVEEYERLTGFSGHHHNVVMHHRASLYGEPCDQCGKPLRTPEARYCAVCGWRPSPEKRDLNQEQSEGPPREGEQV